MSLVRNVLLRGETARTASRTITRARVWLLVGAITMGAFALRVWTIRQSLPYVDHPDEPNPITYVVEMLRTGDPNQHFFQKPSLYVYLLLTVLSVHYRWGVASGLYTSLEQMQVTTHIVTTIPDFFIWARTFTAVIGSLTVLSVSMLGTRVWSRSAGLIGALFVATLPFHVQFSQYVTTDVTSAWLVLLTTMTAMLVAQTGHWRAYLVAGIFAGFAASTKYNAGVVALTILVAHSLYWGRQSLRRSGRLVGAGIAAIAGFVIGTPYILLSWSEVSGGIIRQWNAYDGGNGNYRGAWNVAGYAEFFWSRGLLPVACLAVPVGLFLLVRRQRTPALVWLSFVVPSLLLHLSRPTHFMQNMLPLLVLCALPVGVVGAAAVEWLAGRMPNYRVAVVGLMLAVLLLPTTVASARYVWRQHQGDTRVQMLAWIETTVPPGVRIAAELKPVPHPAEGRWTDIDKLPQRSLEWYRQQGYAYLVASSDRWGQLQIPESYVPFTARPPVAEFGSYNPRTMLGPHLFVYATGLSEADVPVRPANVIRMGGARFLGVSLIAPDGSVISPGARAEYRAGSSLGLRTFWSIEQSFDQDFFIFVHILADDGTIVAQRDAPPWQGRFPTSSWQPGSLVVDVNDVPLSPGIPSGEYTVAIGMFNPVTGAYPPVSVAGQTQTPGSVPITQVTITR